MASARFGSGALLGATLLGVLAGAGMGSLFQGDAPAVRDAEPIEVSLDPEVTEGTPKTGAMNLALDSDGDSRTVAAAGSSAGTLSTARIQEAMSKVDTPTILASAGKGVIRGRVLDEDGAPLEGVELVASVRSQGATNVTSRANSWMGAPEVKTLEQQMTDAAEAWAKSRANRHLARSDASGNFTLDSLVEGTYDVRAYKANWAIRADGQYETKTGSDMKFQALPVTELELDVRMPDSSVATDVVVQSVAEGFSTSFLEWSPENPALRFSQKQVTLKAFSGITESGYLREDPRAAFCSDEFLVDLTSPQGSPMVIQLAGINGVSGTVTWELEDDNSSYSNVVAVRTESIAALDDSLPVMADYSVRARAGQFHFSRMEPGTYAVGITDWRTKVFLPGSVTFVEVGASIVPVSIHVPAPPSEGLLVLTCRDLDGKPVAIDRVTYDLRTGRSGGSGGLTIKAGAGDTYLAKVDDFNRLDYMNWPAGASLHLLVISKEMGALPVTLSSGQLSLNLTFSPPVSLTVTVAGYESSTNKSQLSVLLQEASAKLDRPLDLRDYNGRGPKFTPDGVMVFPAVAAGTWRVVLMSDNTELDFRTITIANADATVQLTAPVLYEQTIVAPTLLSGARLSLDRVDGPPALYGDSQNLNADKRCRFSGLVAGTYEISYYGDNGAAAPVRIQVPGPEFVFEPKSPNAMIVKIVNEGGTLYLDGFRDGDIMTHINGKALADLASMQMLLADFMAGDADVKVLRSGSTISVTMSKVEMTPNAEIKLGGTFEPTYLE